MGYSCSKLASIRYDAISEFCYKQTGVTNQWKNPKNGNTYFLQIGRENRDGSITGSIHRIHQDIKTTCEKTGSFRIGRDGKEFSGPAILRDIQAYELYIDNQSHREFPPSLEPNESNLFDEVLKYAKSLELGGVNQHISKSLGYIPYPRSAKIISINTGEFVTSWMAEMFQIW